MVVMSILQGNKQYNRADIEQHRKTYVVDDPRHGRDSECALLKECAAGQLKQLAQSVASSLQAHKQIQLSLQNIIIM